MLAIGEPLSLQAHPSAAQAAAGFAREEAAGVPIDAPDRCYRDASPKPEALVAIRPSWALCGFRAAGESAGLLRTLGVEALAPSATALEAAEGNPQAESAARRSLLEWLLGLEGDERTALASAIAGATVVAAAPPPSVGPPVDPCSWVRALGETHPGDPLAVAPLILNLLPLAPGEALHLPAGNLHAYLRGAGVEIMAASDNVLRGGLTPKHVDVDELVSVLRFGAGVPEGLQWRSNGPVTTYDADEEAFALAVVDAAAGPVELMARAPALLLATGGSVEVAGRGATMVLEHGLGAFVAPDPTPVRVSGTGWLWWATTGGGLPP